MTGLPADSVADLVRFLIARIEDDERELASAQRTAGPDGGAGSGVTSTRRQRVECDVKRQLIGHAQHLLVMRDLPSERQVRDVATHLLRALAEPYSRHCAYRSEWAIRQAAVDRQLLGRAR